MNEEQKKQQVECEENDREQAALETEAVR